MDAHSIRVVTIRVVTIDKFQFYATIVPSRLFRSKTT